MGEEDRDTKVIGKRNQMRITKYEAFMKLVQYQPPSSLFMRLTRTVLKNEAGDERTLWQKERTRIEKFVKSSAQNIAAKDISNFFET